MELKYEEVANKIDKNILKMTILVYDNNTSIINEKEKVVASKEVICHKCGQICLIDFREYKVILENCRNKHENKIRLD